MRRTMMVVAGLCLSIAATIAPAGATDAEEPDGELTFEATVTVETYKPDNRTLLSRATYGQETEGVLMGADATAKGPSRGGGVVAMASGSGGSTSASGCRKVTVNNEAETVLGFTAYWFHTWTRWCWTRSTQVVYDVSTGWSISDVDSQQYWRGIVNSEFLFYDYSTNDGHPKSAYKHYRQGQFENCVLKYGCIGTTYPANTLRSYYNGTWAWETDG